MHPYHKWLTYFQLLLLVVLTVTFFISKSFYLSIVFPALCIFFLSEIGILEIQRKENPNVRIYRKSCWFGLVDTASVIAFLGLFAISGYYFFTNTDIGVSYPFILYSYIIIRKFYILKHWTYEK